MCFQNDLLCVLDLYVFACAPAKVAHMDFLQLVHTGIL